MANTTYEFRITGMDCAACAQSIERGVAQLPGVAVCTLNFTTERLHVQGPINRAAIVQRVHDLGFVALPAADQDSAPVAPAAPPSFWAFLWSRSETRLALLGALLIVPGLIFHELLRWQAWWIDLLGVLALLVAGGPVVRSAWRALTISRDLNINVLMTIAAAGAVVTGAYTEAGMVMVLFALGEALEGYTSTRARHAVRSLMAVVPETAVRLTMVDDLAKEDRVAVADLAVGNLILVRPGERIAMDGIVRAGESRVDQAPITGESLPVEKQPGDTIFAGTINGGGALEVTITRVASENTIARMVRLVAEAQARRAPLQRVVDQFARIYTPLVVLLALLVAVVPPLVAAQPFWGDDGWLYRALTLLVVACPCALVISTPVSIISALTAAARTGVLIKGGAALEALARVRVIAFDKTGTLTAGRPQVVAVRSADCANLADDTSCPACDDLLALAGAVERRSEHPLAHAIVAAAAAQGLDARYPAAEGVTALVGQGVRGTVAMQTILIGSHSAFDRTVAHTAAHCAAASADAAQGYTPLMLSADGAYRGTISVADTVRASSRAAVADLHALGLRAVVMLTGDNAGTAQRIAADVGVTDVRAELLPEQKVAAIQQLTAQHGPVAMVGDGINDAPALATASVGIAIGGAHGGSNQAMETADVTLMSDDLRQLSAALRLSRAALRTVRVNIALSIGIKLVFLALVLAGLGTMWMAVLADVGVALLVTLNGMRLLRWRAPVLAAVNG